MGREAVVIGAGLGGLATALRLRAAGWDVTVLEKNDSAGGRCNRLQSEGYTFDTGPTLLLMRDVLDDLFASLGESVDERLDLMRVFPNYSVHFGDGSQVTLSADLEAVESAFEGIEPGGGAAFRRYLADAGYKYRISRERFVERNFAHWYNFATLTNLYFLLTTNTLRSLQNHAGRYFKDPRSIAALTFQTMYLGLAPAQAPAVYSLLPYTELLEGIWFPRGGMYRIVEAMQDLALERGVRLRLSTEVTSIHTVGRRASGVELSTGDFVRADVVISNADLPYAYANLLPDSRRGRFTNRTLRRLDYGSSAFLLYLGVDREFPRLHHHDVFLSRDTAKNFDAIFQQQQLPDDPSFYLCTASRTDRSLAPEGHEAIYVLVPVPHLTPETRWGEIAGCYRDRIFDRLAQVGLGDIQRQLVFERMFTPLDFQREYNIVAGSAFGLSHGIRQVGYMRPANKASDLDNMYFVGASTVPGGGVPMVIIGSRLVTERVLGDWGHG